MERKTTYLNSCLKGVLLLCLTFCMGGVHAQTPTMIVNEISNGSSGLKEFMEFVVLADPVNNCAVDIRGVIFDDNNGDFSCGPASSRGIAQGHGRFSPTDPTWSSIPSGSIIVIYNDGDTDAAMPASDPTDSNTDGVYIVPISHPSLEMSSTFPDGANACPGTGTSTYGGSTYGAGGIWGSLGMRNSGDAGQLRDISGNYMHGIGYGTTSSGITGGPDNLMVANINGGGDCFFFVDGDYTDVSNFATAPASANQTPGAANNAANAAFVANQTCILPVTFERQLTAQWEGDNAVLSWKTIEEINFDYFEIERADQDDPEFFPIDRVNSNELNDYEFIDRPNYGLHTWYRLRVVDIDGSSEYSKIAGLYVQPNEEDMITEVYPNPVETVLNFNFGIAQDVEVVIYDMQGRVAAQTSMEGRGTLDVQDWNSGIYFWHARSGVNSRSGKFIVR